MTDILVLVGVVVVAVLITDRCGRQADAEWEARVERVQESARINLQRTVEALQEESRQSARADSIAQEVEERAPEIQERIDTVRVRTPAELEDHPAIVERDSIIDDLVEERDDALAAFEQQKRATATLRNALEESRETVDSLSTVLEERPGGRPWFVPRIGIGPGAGIGFDGKPYAGVGVNLSWQVSL